MKRLTVGLDIDGVIVDIGIAMLPLLSEVCNRPVLYEDLRYWNLGEALNVDEKTVAHIWETTLKNGKTQTIYFFAKEEKEGALGAVPAGYVVSETKNGLPVLKRA